MSRRRDQPARPSRASDALGSHVDTTSRVEAWLGEVLREQRVRLVNRLGGDVPLALSSLDAGQARDLPDALTGAGVRLRAAAQLAPSGTPLLVGLDAVLVTRVVSRLLGGSGHADDAVHRAPTPADVRVATRVVDDLIAGLAAALPTGCTERVAVGELGTSAGLPLAPTTAVFRARVRVGPENEPLGHAVLAFPRSMATTLWPDERPTSDATDDLSRVLPITIEAVAELARVTVPLAALNRLQIGDTLDLGRMTETVIRVRGEATLRGEAGTVDGVRCVRIHGRTNRRGG